MVWLSGLLPYDQAVQVFARIGRCDIPATSIWRQAQRHGERMQRYEAERQTHVAVERTVLPPPGLDHTDPVS